MYWLLNRLAFHFFVVVLGSMLSMLLSIWIGSLWSFAIMALLWIPLMAILPEMWSKWTGQKSSVHWVMFLLFLLPVYVCTSQFPGLFEMYRMGPVRTIAVSDIDAFPNDYAFQFHDGSVQREFRYLRTAKSYDSRRSSTTTNYYLVAPITGSQWTREEPIHAWAVYSPANWTREDGPHWNVDNGVGIQCDAIGAEAFREAIQSACVEHKLVSSSNARLLQWTVSVQMEITNRIRIILVSVLGTYIGWMLLYCVQYIFQGKKRVVEEESGA